MNLGAAHRLAAADRAATPEEAARSVVALHATDPATVHLSVAARTAGPGAPVADIERALYGDRTLVRVMAMRRTMWAVPSELAPVVAAACGRAVGQAERRKAVAAIEAQGLAADGAGWLASLEEATVAALADRPGGASASELVELVPELGRSVRLGGASRWAADVTMASRVVIALSCDARLARGRPRGSWTSGQHPYVLAPPFEPLDVADAQAELARRWLAAFGPWSSDVRADLAWWAGWTVAATKAALARAGAVEPGRPGPAVAGGGWAALVPALDPTTMGWKARGWYLGDLAGALFDRNGNAGPAVWCDGRVVGGWAQRAGGEVVWRLLVDVGAEGVAAVEAEAARLQAWLDAAGGAVVRPRFPTPLQTELARSSAGA